MRNDYMLDDKRKTSYTNGHDVNGSLHREFEIKQIEINMIASSFSGLGSQTCKLHRYFKL